jgi:hypothetical protein
VSPVSYELGFHIPKDGLPLSHRRGNLKSYIKQHSRFGAGPVRSMYFRDLTSAAHGSICTLLKLRRNSLP